MKFFQKKKSDDPLIDEEIILKEHIHAPENPNVLTVEELLGRQVHKTENTKSTGALDSLKARMLKANNKADEPTKAETVIPAPKADLTEKAESDNTTLLEKCRPFILNDKGEDTSKSIPPVYKLDSVADILRKDQDESQDDEVAVFNKKYNFDADYLGMYVEKKLAAEKKPTSASQKEIVKDQKSEVPKASSDTIPITAIKNAQTNVSFTISDIDPLNIDDKKTESDISNATITFTPVTNSDDTKILVSSKTRQIDLTGEIAAVEDISSTTGSRVELEKTEFDEFTPENEIKSELDFKRFLRSFSIKKRNHFLALVISALASFVLAFMKMPFMANAVLAQTKPTMIVCCCLLAVIIFANYDMLLSLKSIFKKQSDGDVLACLSALFVLGYAVFGIIKGEIITDLCLLCGITLSLRSIGKFQKFSYLLSNLKQIWVKAPKKAVRLLSDPTVTYAMAKNSIEGDTLIAAPQVSEKLDDYIKHSTFGTFLNGRVAVITAASLVLSALTFFATFKYFDGVFYGLYAAACVQCFAALPSIFFIDNLPLYTACKKLNKRGAMIAGKTGAEQLEMANAVVLNSEDLFPADTVTLQNMRLLSENNMSDTIMRAASLTKEIGSPLYAVFSKIAGAENLNSLPVSDTVKYEERMGISGWVNNELLFIGNRTIMEAHGITVPDIETDRKILRSGCFPVYVATENTAVALLMVKYSVSPAVCKELRRLTQIGVTILVNNTDPNLTNEMICDYLGLYEDAVMVMTTAGSNMYKNILPKAQSTSAPAAYRGKSLSLARIINTANKIRRSNTVLSVAYILTAVIGIIMFAYLSFTSSDSIMNGQRVLLYGLASTAVSYIAYLFQKP